MGQDSSLQQFKECVLDAYAQLLEEEGYRELPDREGRFVNPYSIRIGNSTTVIEVEGIHYGAGAWTKVFRAGEADSNADSLPVFDLINERSPLPKMKKNKERTGQLAEIREDAARIMAHASDVLAGDFSAIERVEKKLRTRNGRTNRETTNPRTESGHCGIIRGGSRFQER